MGAASAPVSLYERIGGQEAVMAAVGIFYEKLCADPILVDFFAHMDMAGLAKKQVAFMTWAFDGPDEYRGRNLTVAHAKLVKEMGMGDRHFDATLQHLRETLEELLVAGPDIEEVMEVVESTRNAVLGRK